MTSKVHKMFHSSVQSAKVDVAIKTPITPVCGMPAMFPFTASYIALYINYSKTRSFNKN